MTVDPADAIVLPKLSKSIPQVVPERAMREMFDESVFAEDWKGRRDRAF